jgi:uncharacterized protein YdhG (YjbR/CyaY superfamily)
VLDPEVRAYLDAAPPEHRALFDRLQALVLQAHPGAGCVLAYRMPTFVVGERRLHVGVWKHGLSLYGWEAGRDGGFVARHPELDSGKGTLRLPLSTSSELSDDELLALLRGALDPRT